VTSTAHLIRERRDLASGILFVILRTLLVEGKSNSFIIIMAQINLRKAASVYNKQFKSTNKAS